MPPTDVNQASYYENGGPWSIGGVVFFLFCFFGGGCQGGSERERRVEVIVKIKKK